MATPSSKGGQARMAALNPKQRKSLARKAAAARWDKAKMTKTRKRSGPRSPRNAFGAALVQAQKQLAEAQSQLTYHLSEYHRLRAEIPALMQIVNAFQGTQQGPQMTAYYPMPGVQPPAPVQVPPPDYSLDTVLSDSPIPTFPDPSMTFVMPPPPAPTPPARPPTPSMTQMPRPPLPQRGGGGAIGKPLEEENENQLLDEAEKDPKSPTAGGRWN